MPHQQVARRIRSIMGDRLISGTSVAEAIDMDQRTFSRRYRGVTAFSFDELSRVAMVLGVPFADLVAHEPVDRGVRGTYRYVVILRLIPSAPPEPAPVVVDLAAYRASRPLAGRRSA